MPRTLLLADDSVTIQKVVGISFASEDVALITVDNGEDAIARAREVLPDIVLADAVMPGKSGYEVCEAIKSDPDLRHIPVLLLTGTFEAFDEERAQRAGASGHVAKPFEARTLVDQVNSLLAESASAAPAAATPPTAPELDAEGTDESFEFFDDDLDELAPAQAPARTELLEAESLDFESPDPAFAFGDSEFSAAASEPASPEETPVPEEASVPEVAPVSEEAPRASAPAMAERTIAILPEQSAAEGETPALAESELASLDAVFEQPAPSDVGEDLMGPDLMEPDAEEAPEPLGAAELLGEEGSSDTEEITTPDEAAETDPLEPVSSVANDAFDFESVAPVSAGSPLPGDDPLLRVDSDDLAQATVLDPSGASGFDVSSSDLGEPLLGEPSQTEQPLSEPMDALGMQPADEPISSAPMDALEMQPADEPISSAPMDAFEMQPADEPAEALAESEPVSEAIPEAPLPLSEAGAQMEAALSEIAPQLREQIHDTLEKIAWESFSDVTEKIVRQAVERVESIAWEVIPQLAETLVREEIRRMKREIEDS
jgi:CheY-like chemotaxis protein